MREKNWKALSLEETRNFAQECYRNEKNVPDKWESYSPEIVQLIDDYTTQGNYPYNRNIEKLAIERLFPEIPDELDGANQNKYLSLIVYNSQSFRHERDDKAKREAEALKLQEQGFIQATKDELEKAANDRKRCLVAFPGRKPERFTAIKNRDAVLWVKQVNSRRGVFAEQGEWIKYA